MTLSLEQATAKLRWILADSHADFTARVVNIVDGYFVEFRRGDQTVWRRIPYEWLDDAEPGALGRIDGVIEHVRRALDIV